MNVKESKVMKGWINLNVISLSTPLQFYNG